ncbi:MAG: hypothetical protein ACRD01_12665 [Terriglobales bacterium]
MSLAIWIGVCACYALALAASFTVKLDRAVRWCIRAYFAVALACNFLTHSTLLVFGFRSAQYTYAYFGADLLCIFAGYLVLSRLLELAFEKSKLRLTRLRSGAILLFAGLTAIGALSVFLLRGRLTVITFSLQMEQDFSFLGMALALVLFAIVAFSLVEGLRFRRIVLSFSLLYSVGAIAYAIALLAPTSYPLVGRFVIPAISLPSTLLIAYSLLVPEREPARRAMALRRVEEAA